MTLSGGIVAGAIWAAATGAAAQEVPYLSLARVEPGGSVCAGGLCQSEALSPLFRRLAMNAAGEAPATVQVLQLGDSHTAGGRITGALRARLQTRFGFASDGAQGGVRLVEYGEVGATLRRMQDWGDAEVSGGAGDGPADLVILAFGTNEGFEDGLDPVAYEAVLRGQIDRLRRLTPGAALLILGAPDALRSGAAGGCSADGQRAPPASLAVVRDVQRRVAADLGVAFWDWHGRMGGDCSADRLALGAEPLMRGDRVHFTNAGADWIGGVLAEDLMAAYDAWSGGRGGAA
ncbi:MAG: GDSL-type esterase/lipase family protein [Brevundimonas sp.]